MNPLRVIQIRLPAWIHEWIESRPAIFARLEDRMQFVIELAEENVRQQTGGPFGAAVFELETGRLVAPGVNLVVPQGNSVAHAELVALMLAQQLLGSHDLGAPNMPACQIVSSTEPCAMCMGAVPWSGVQSLVCGARDEDARAIGMDEGVKPENWVEEFHQRGIVVVRDICRDRASQVLRQYADRGGLIYNGRQGRPAP